MSKLSIIFIILIITLFSGCSTTRALKSARGRIIELEQLNEERTARNLELEELNDAERAGNQELGNLLLRLQTENSKYIESERNRLEAEKFIIDSFTGIFEEGEDIIERLIRGYNLIRKYFEDQGLLAETVTISPDSNGPDNNS